MAPVGFPAIAWIPPYVAQVPTAITAVALRRQPVQPLVGRPRLAGRPGRCRTRTSTRRCPCSALVGDRSLDDQDERLQLAAVGLVPPLDEVVGPCSGPHSKSINGQCTAILGSPGSAPSTISSMLGWVAAVRATESPSQPSPPFIQRMWTTPSSSWVCRLSAVAVVTVAHLLCGDAHAPTSSAGCCCDNLTLRRAIIGARQETPMS